MGLRERSLGTLFKRYILNTKKNEIPSSLFIVKARNT